ncbi:hypothetical protein RF11_09825 [Thelohanellus kitauei]|uniref:Uncharacterized protein n=1 Tax=Thelohanellus kitauei TaxID=669202 RepID=A0A0C2NGW6_THEKT|nr:hypothetical protein RF11_09825 [Thelohanellus kitauei]
MSPHSLEANGQPFFRRYWVGDIHGEQNRIIILATNESLALMRYNSQTFFDWTLKIRPHPFYQCIIIMVYDDGTNLYVPCVALLSQGRTNTYIVNYKHQIIILMEYNWMPRAMTTYFEKALI